MALQDLVPVYLSNLIFHQFNKHIICSCLQPLQVSVPSVRMLFLLFTWLVTAYSLKVKLKC